MRDILARLSSKDQNHFGSSSPYRVIWHSSFLAFGFIEWNECTSGGRTRLSVMSSAIHYYRHPAVMRKTSRLSNYANVTKKKHSFASIDEYRKLVSWNVEWDALRKQINGSVDCCYDWWLFAVGGSRMGRYGRHHLVFIVVLIQSVRFNIIWCGIVNIRKESFFSFKRLHRKTIVQNPFANDTVDWRTSSVHGEEHSGFQVNTLVIKANSSFCSHKGSNEFDDRFFY